MRLPFVLFVLLLFFNYHLIYAQTPVVEWYKTFGGPNGDYAQSIEPTKDGGYIVAGYVESGGGDILGYHGNTSVNDIWVAKLNSTGKIEWQKCLGGTWFETGADIRQTPDGGYILAGTSTSTNCTITGNLGGADFWVIKLTAAGEITWQKHFGGSKNEYAYSIDLTSDGGYIVSGDTESSDGNLNVNYGMHDYWVIKIDGAGNLKWQKSIGGSGEDQALSVKATSDGGCIVAGTIFSSDGDFAGNHGIRDIGIAKLDNTGNIQWKKCLGGSGFEECRSIQLTTDGGYIINGSTSSYDGDVLYNHPAQGGGYAADFWVVKLSSAGNLQWQKSYGGGKNDNGYFIQLTPDGGYILSGTSESSDGDVTCMKGVIDILLIKINSAGTLEWTKSLGGISYDEAFSVQPLKDGGYIIARTTCSPDVSGYHPPTTMGTCADYWIVKLSAPVTTPPNPILTIFPASGNVCAGASTTFTAAATYAGTNPVYQWTINGTGAGTNSATYTSTVFSNNDVLACKVTSGGECNNAALSSAGSVTIKINTSTIQPKITITTSNTSVCSCTSTTFKSAVLNPGPTPLCQWKVNGIVTDNNTGSYITKDLVAGDIINCTLSDTTGCIASGFVVSNEIIMDAGIGAAPTVSITSSSGNICAGQPITFNAFPVNAGTNPSFQWKQNGVNVGADSDSFTSATILNRDKVECWIIIDPQYACVNILNANSNTIKIVVSDKVTPSVAIQTLATTICKGSITTFNATASNAGSLIKYQWKINGINTGTDTAVLSTSNLKNADAVTCIIAIDPLFTCANSPTATSNSIVITINNVVPPSISIAADSNNVCAGTQITFIADAKNAGQTASYQWMVNNLAINNSTAIFSSKNLANGDAVYCIVNPGSGACSPAVVASNTVIAILNPLPVIVSFSQGDTTIKTGDQVQFASSVSANSTSYTWSPADKLESPLTLNPLSVHLLKNTNFILSVLSDKGCEATIEAIVKVGIPLIMPSAFTPNNDGINDIFRIPPGVLLQLKEFSIFDRWGNKVFKTGDINAGWNGTLNGKQFNSASFIYLISGEDSKGKVFVRGTVLLIK